MYTENKPIQKIAGKRRGVSFGFPCVCYGALIQIKSNEDNQLCAIILVAVASSLAPSLSRSLTLSLCLTAWLSLVSSLSTCLWKYILQAFLLERSRASITKPGPSPYFVVEQGEDLERRRSRHQRGRDFAVAAAAADVDPAAVSAVFVDSASSRSGAGVVMDSGRNHGGGHVDGVAGKKQEEEEAGRRGKGEQGKARPAPPAVTTTGGVADPQKLENDDFLRLSGGGDSGSTVPASQVHRKRGRDGVVHDTGDSLDEAFWEEGALEMAADGGGDASSRMLQSPSSFRVCDQRHPNCLARKRNLCCQP